MLLEEVAGWSGLRDPQSRTRKVKASQISILENQKQHTPEQALVGAEKCEESELCEHDSLGHREEDPRVAQLPVACGRRLGWLWQRRANGCGGFGWLQVVAGGYGCTGCGRLGWAGPTNLT